ncbi:SprB-like repeat protein [Neolewinella xylanilytica]|uniref:SprB-like repeat protein n=1 Tax=Neolewinella xylanilytica TaxID=1514080 RepID=A0A2S6I6N8_9BACT|nr:gliding motility-associated C-terminal domain-containing protein [Neolewinella xylanilytica]PPK87145.1 SprB-like repeat protein [Neolewinella xylanilytica]
MNITLKRRTSNLALPIFLVCVGLCGGSLSAQTTLFSPLQRTTVAASSTKQLEKVVCDSDAGNVAGFTNINVSNNSFGATPPTGPVAYAARPDTIFLCFNDGITVDFEEGSQILTGDPVPETQSGIGFAFFACNPSVEGNTKADIEGDPCIVDLGFPPYDGEILVGAPSGYYNSPPNYDLNVDNDNLALLTAFGGGAAFSLAPITIDSLNAADPNNAIAIVERETDVTTECINVSTDQNFTVAFLLPIEAQNATQSTTDCSGSFEVLGGVSELRGTADYNISITNTATGAAGSVASGPIRHGDVVSYTVPEAGDYEIVIEDGIGCGYQQTVTHTATCAEPPPSANLTVGAVAIQEVSCPGAADGMLTAAITGGTAPYTVRLISGGGTLLTTETVANDGGIVVFDNLSGGNYQIEAEDATGATVNSNPRLLFLDEDDEFIPFVVDATGGSCAGSIDYALTVEINVNAGSQLITNPTENGYTVNWSTGETTDTIRNVTPGNLYSVTVTNVATGCPVLSQSFRLPARSEVIIAGAPATDDASCRGSSDGTVTLEARGGVPGANGYTFTFSDGETRTGRTVNRADLEPGTYTVIATDSVGCSSSILEGEFVIQTDKEIVPDVTVSDISCFGEVDGSLSVNANVVGTRGATPPFESRLSALDGTVLQAYTNIPVGSPLVYDNLPEGTYLVTVRDQDPAVCITTDTFEIVEPDSLFIEDLIITNFACPDTFGTATVQVSGGTGPYQFRFRNDSLPDPVDSLMTFDSLVVDTNFIGDLQPDTNYVVIVTDARGCIDSTTFRITAPPRAAISPIQTDSVSCTDSSDGQLFAEVTPPPGTTITETVWYRLEPDGSIGEQVDIGTRTTADLEVGFYLFEVTISNNCVSQALGEVASPGLVGLDSVALVQPVCLGDENGSIFLYPSGGTRPYRYDWSVDGAGTTASSLTGLSAGTYSVTITDANNCQPPFDTTFVLEEPVGITGEFTSLVPVSCPDESTTDGSATFSARLTDGSTPTFDFYWSSGDTTENRIEATVTDLSRGPITVTVTDGLCPQQFTDTIPSPPEFTFDQEIVDASCNGQQNGSATVIVEGGTPGYTYDWTARPESGNAITGVGAGTYEVNISDANGCVATPQELTILEPDALVLAIDDELTTPTVTCNGDADGRLAVFVSSNNNNAFPDNPYQWTSNVADNDDGVANELAPGTYGVTVTDVEGCQDSLQYTVIEPQPITFAVESIQDPLCFGETTSVMIDTAFGGQASDLDDFTYMLNNDGFLIPVRNPGLAFAGALTVTVFDSVGCSAEQNFTIDQPEEITIDLPNRLIVELGDSLEQLNPVVSPPGNYTYQWTPGTYLSSDSIRNPTVFALGNVNYTFTATNPNGCQAIEDILVEIDPNRNVYIPTAFSPNRDGRNEDFRIFACRGVTAIPLVQIFDRWGGLMFEAENLPVNCLDGTVIWDGQSADGRDANTGVYVYTAEVSFLDGQTLTYRGEISVLR